MSAGKQKSIVITVEQKLKNVIKQIDKGKSVSKIRNELSEK